MIEPKKEKKRGRARRIAGSVLIVIGFLGSLQASNNDGRVAMLGMMIAGLILTFYDNIKKLFKKKDDNNI